MKYLGKLLAVLVNTFFGVCAVVIIACGKGDVFWYGILIGLLSDILIWFFLRGRKNRKDRGRFA
jgi:hypothetical protein